MRILSYKPGHDGQVSYLDGDELVFSIEAEKDSGDRYSPLVPSTFIHTLRYLEQIPDIVAISGWGQDFQYGVKDIEGGYFGEGLGAITERKQNFLGQEIVFFSSSHERAHLMGAYAMSPFEQGQPCYALLWEGKIGAFYHIDESVRITKIGDVFERTGYKYAFLYALADPTFVSGRRFEDAGKLMALCSYGQSGHLTPEERIVVDQVFALKSKTVQTPNGDDQRVFPNFDKLDFKDSPFYNIGLQHPDFTTLAKKFSDELFDVFHSFAQEHLDERLPLLITGGCGLNCEWNSKWQESGLFMDVFIPPCPNDSGVTIGTAVDALFHYTGKAKIKWDVYSGEEFVFDDDDFEGMSVKEFDINEVAEFLASGKVIAWVQGRTEIGPRALGNRSLLAPAFDSAMCQRLNEIKQREDFRPIAPIVLEEDIDHHFDNQGPSPYMLHFQRVIDPNLGAVTHVDGSARMQSVNRQQNASVYDLLVAFKQVTGTGVLCNTSLNFKGKGFINRMSDLKNYAKNQNLDGFVVSDRFFILE